MNIYPSMYAYAVSQIVNTHMMTAFCRDAVRGNELLAPRVHEFIIY